MANISKQAGAQVIIIAMEIPPNYGARYAQGFRDSFSYSANETDSIVAPFLLADIAVNPQLMQGDGIHPRPEAQARMMEAFLPTLLEVLP